jgi:hypothetical protein
VIQNNFIKDKNIFLSQKISQNIILQNTESKEALATTDIYTNINLNNIQIFSNIVYLYENNSINKNSLGIDINTTKQSYNLSYFYKNNSQSNYISAYAKFNISNDLLVGINSDFDINQKRIKRWGLFLQKDQGCWKYNLKLGQSILPVFKQNTIDLETNTIFNVSIDFKPFGSISHNYYF